jgi:hypothetical protein
VEIWSKQTQGTLIIFIQRKFFLNKMSEQRNETKKVVLYTAIYGDYDDLILPTKQSTPCDFIFFSDKEVRIYDLSPSDQDIPKLKSTHPPYDPWTKDRQLKDVGEINRKIMTVALLKCDPSNNPFLEGYDIVIYVDGNIHIFLPQFIEYYFVGPFSKDPNLDIIVSKHP